MPSEADHLTARERETLALIATGKSNDEIAQEMQISLNSVKSYIRSAYRKTGVQSRSQAVLWAVIARRARGRARAGLSRRSGERSRAYAVAVGDAVRAGPLAATDQHLAQHVGPVGDDPVDADVEQ